MNLTKTLEELKKEMRIYGGKRKGKDEGKLEEEATWASEVIDIVNELQEKLKEQNSKYLSEIEKLKK